MLMLHIDEGDYTQYFIKYTYTSDIFMQQQKHLIQYFTHCLIQRVYVQE